MIIDSVEERNHGMKDARKISELTSFFVAFKEALELGTSGLPAFVSSRTTQAIDDSGTWGIILLY